MQTVEISVPKICIAYIQAQHRPAMESGPFDFIRTQAGKTPRLTVASGDVYGVRYTLNDKRLINFSFNEINTCVQILLFIHLSQTLRPLFIVPHQNTFVNVWIVDNKKRMSGITAILQQILQTNKYEQQIAQCYMIIILWLFTYPARQLGTLRSYRGFFPMKHHATHQVN